MWLYQIVGLAWPLARLACLGLPYVHPLFILHVHWYSPLPLRPRNPHRRFPRGPHVRRKSRFHLPHPRPRRRRPTLIYGLAPIHARHCLPHLTCHSEAPRGRRCRRCAIGVRLRRESRTCPLTSLIPTPPSPEGSLSAQGGSFLRRQVADAPRREPIPPESTPPPSRNPSPRVGNSVRPERSRRVSRTE